MKPWNEITHYAGLDWAKSHHQIVIADCQGQILAEWQFDHSLEGWKQWRERTASYPGLAIATETNQGATVDQLLHSGSTVYPVNPRSAKVDRQRKVSSNNKTDQLDAWSLGATSRPAPTRPSQRTRIWAIGLYSSCILGF